MARVVQSGQYFVVGGPVQPDRPCYIERAADRALRQAIDDRQFGYVLGPRASGKSSLMARSIRALRQEGQLVAVVDLTPHLSRHYAKVQEELARRRASLAGRVGADYIDRMLVGLGHWIDGGKRGYLSWGIMRFRS